jgi:hypothetical protein
MSATQKTKVSDELLRRFAAALRAVQLYAPAHPLVARSIDAFAEIVGLVHATAPSIVTVPVRSAGAADPGASADGALEAPELEHAPMTSIAAKASAPRRFGFVTVTSWDPPGWERQIPSLDVVTVGGRGQRAVCALLTVGQRTAVATTDADGSERHAVSAEDRGWYGAP